MFDTHKTRMIGLLCGEETITIRKAVFVEYRNAMDRQTDGQRDRIAISISRFSMLTRGKTCESNTNKANLKYVAMLITN